MEKAYKLRIYPNKKQRELLSKTFGCSRFIYNHYLKKRIDIYESSGETFDFYKCSKDLTNLKQELEWLRDVDKFALQNSLKDLECAYKKFFKEKSCFPNFKSKKTHKFSYRTNLSGQNIRIGNKYIRLPKLGYVRYRDNQIPQGRILNVTVSQMPSGKYYCSICCTDIDVYPFSKTGLSVGIDLGIKEFAVTSDGEHIKNNKYLKKSLAKLARLQKELSRKTSGSSNRNKARIKVAKQYEKVSNQRRDFLNKLSSSLIKKYDIIYIEDLNIKGMVKNHKLASSILDTSWSDFISKLQYKANWNDKRVIKVNRFFASSQTCHNCGFVNNEVKNLSIRNWTCPSCGISHQRDENASINIFKEGLKLNN